MKTAIVIGAGHNGLIAAFYLAKAGVKPIVLEARAEVGGGAITGEIHPGFHCPTLTHEVLLQQQIVGEMNLAQHGLQLLRPQASVCALSRGGPLVIDGAAPSFGPLNAKDAAAYAAFK